MDQRSKCSEAEGRYKTKGLDPQSLLLVLLSQTCNHCKHFLILLIAVKDSIFLIRPGGPLTRASVQTSLTWESNWMLGHKYINNEYDTAFLSIGFNGTLHATYFSTKLERKFVFFSSPDFGTFCFNIQPTSFKCHRSIFRVAKTGRGKVLNRLHIFVTLLTLYAHTKTCSQCITIKITFKDLNS